MKKFYKHLILPIFSIIAGLVIAGYGIYTYINDVNISNWDSANAVVIDNTIRSDSDSNGTIYIITYEYTAPNGTYQNTFNSQSPVLINSEIEIRYNHNHNSESAIYSEPSLSDMAFYIIFGLIFIITGIIFTIVLARNKYIIAETEEYAAKERSKDKAKNRIDITSTIKHFLPLIIFMIIALLLMRFQPFQKL